MEALLTASIVKRFDRFELQADLSLGPGITAVVGPSGSGKTTVIRCVAGLERPERGRIALCDEVWYDSAMGRHLSAQQRRVGFVFNDYALFPHLSVLQNVGYAARTRARASELLALLDLSSLRDRFPRQLSAGQQQRVAIARALAAEPRVLLMDEPFSSLDLHLKERLYGEFLALQHRLGILVVLVTHDLAEASLLAGEIIVLSGGRILQTGTPRDVLFHPRLPQVANLVGIRNVFEGRLAPGGRMQWGHRMLELPGVERPGTAVRWCIRADQVEVAMGPDELVNEVGGIVREMALVSFGYRFVCEVEGIGDLEIHVPLAIADRIDLAPGRLVRLSLPPRAIHLFEAEARSGTGILAKRSA